VSNPDGFEPELAECEAVIARHGDAPEVESRREASAALLQKSSILGRLGRFDEAVAVLDEPAARHGDAEDEEVRHDVVRGLEQQGHVLRELGRGDDARAAVERAKALGREWLEPPPEAMQAHYDRACALEDEGRTADALTVLADLVNAWPDGPPEEAVTLRAQIDGQLGAAREALGLSA
jgi:tetratricopeptide (TPR) repeat protein